MSNVTFASLVNVELKINLGNGLPISSLVATFEQSENVTIVRLVGADCYEGCGL